MKSILTLARLWFAGLFFGAGRSETASTETVNQTPLTSHNIIFPGPPVYVVRSAAEASRILGLSPNMVKVWHNRGHVQGSMLPNPNFKNRRLTLHMTEQQLDQVRIYAQWRADNGRRHFSGMADAPARKGAA